MSNDGLASLSPPWRRLFLGMCGAACTVVVAAGIRSVAGVLNPVLAAAFLALLLAPVLRRLRGPLGGAAAAVVALVVVLAGVVVAGFVGASLGRLATELPRYQPRMQVLLNAVDGAVASHGIDVSTYVHSALSGPALGGTLVRTSTVVAGAVGDLVLTYIIFLFMLGGMAEVERRASSDSPDYSPLAARFLALSSTVAGFVGSRVLLGLAAALLEYLLMLAVGVDYALLWAVLSFILSFVPTFGLALAMIPPISLTLLSRGWLSALIVFLGYEAINIVMDNVLLPRVAGKQVDLPPLLSFLAVLLWAWLLGPIGAILSIPLTVTMRDLAFRQAEPAVQVAPRGVVAPTVPAL